MRYRMWRIILYDYLFTTELWHVCSTAEYFEVMHRHLIDVGLRKSPCVCFRVSIINYSLVCSLPIHTKALTNAQGLSVEIVASRGPDHAHLRDSLSSLLGPSHAQNLKSVALAVANVLSPPPTINYELYRITIITLPCSAAVPPLSWSHSLKFSICRLRIIACCSWRLL